MKLYRSIIELPNLSVDTSERLEGLSVTQVIADLLQHILPAKYKTYTAAETKRFAPHREMGFMWERVIEEAFRASQIGLVNSLIRPGGLEEDGIVMHPDGMDMRTGELEEWKATWKTSRRAEQFESEFTHWIYQGAAYARRLDTRVANYRVFWVNGNYADSGPYAERFRVEWTKRELEENWQNIVRWSRRLRDGSKR